MTKHLLTAPDATASELASIEILQRRTFLFSLGALTLTGCGAGSNSIGSASPPFVASHTLTGGVMLAGFCPSRATAHRGRHQSISANIDVESWKSGCNMLVNNPYVKLSYSPAAVPIVYRGYDGVHAENYTHVLGSIPHLINFERYTRCYEH